MSTVTRPRGPLPARVYWTRRLLLVAVVFALVFGVAQLLGRGGSGDPAARPVGADVSSSAPTQTRPVRTPPAAPTPTASQTHRQGGGATTAAVTPTPTPTPTPSATPLAIPSGPCLASDIVATPTLQRPAYAGRPVVFAMRLTTVAAPACTWELSARSLAVKVTSGSDRIWSTQDCRDAVPERSVVVRKDQPATVGVGWSGQRSDSGCTRSPAWAEPGYYHVVAAAFGAEPTDVQFRLQAPPRPTITATPKPKKNNPTATPRR